MVNPPASRVALTPPEHSPRDLLRKGGTREDSATAAREEVALYGREGARLFTCTHVPGGPSVAGLVICSPLHAEFLHNYRKEVILARSLAAAGVAVQRFHYRGSGNSDGATDAVTFQSMLEDTLTAFHVLQSKAQVGDVAFLGTRVSGSIAASAAREFDDAPLALWQPVLDPESYFRELFRTASIRELRHDASVAGTSRGRSRPTMQTLESAGVADVLGYAIHRALYVSLRDHRLVDELGQHPRPVLLLQLDRDDALRKEYAELTAMLRTSGFDMRTRAIRADDHWWFSGDPAHAASTLKTVVGETARWLHAIFGQA
jgi:hypothetical protein